MTGEFMGVYNADGTVARRPGAPTTPGAYPRPHRLAWSLGSEARAGVQQALTEARALIADFDLCIAVNNAYGKGFIKKCKVSPDGWVQMAMQLAYYKVGAA